MSVKAGCLFALTTALALTANACSVSTAHVVDVASVSEAPRRCLGGLVQTANDAKHYAGCVEVEGDLRIDDAALSDLSDFSSLRSVLGALVVTHNSELSDLTGLENLRGVDRLEIGDNAGLSNLNALQALRSAPIVEIRNNPELKTLRGLEGLQRVDALELVNDGLTDTSGLEQLREVGELTIADDAKLISLHGLNSVTRARSVQIRNNRLLCAQLGFLPQLGEVSDQLVLTSNPSVSKREIDGLRQHVKPAFERPIVLGGELALH
jgi:hypothetical protein